MQSTISLPKSDLASVVKEVFLVLTPKEQDIVVKRFALEHNGFYTLERIGQKYSVTRERIRQIEKVALTKLRRTSPNTRFKAINDVAKGILVKHGGIMEEETLTKMVLQVIGASQDVDAHIAKLAFHISSDMRYFEKPRLIRPFWRLGTMNAETVRGILNGAYSIMAKKGDVIPADLLAEHVRRTLDDAPIAMVMSALPLDLRFKLTKEGYGLMEWRHINPKSIRDKAFIVLKKAGRPMHFSEIAAKITEAHFDQKAVTTQAVHNELIRFDQFVLVGRGLYGLKAWGYKQGTVSEIIEQLLKRKSALSKQDIINSVLKQRFVKKGTVSLNLQKNPQFVRVGRAMYALKK